MELYLHQHKDLNEVLVCEAQSTQCIAVSDSYLGGIYTQLSHALYLSVRIIEPGEQKDVLSTWKCGYSSIVTQLNTRLYFSCT